MLTSIRAILQENGVSPDNTPYQDICEYMFSAADFFSVESIAAYRSIFSVFAECEKDLTLKNASLRDELAHVTKQIKQIKASEFEPSADTNETLRCLRGRKKELAVAIAANERDYYHSKPERFVLSYKNLLVVNTFNNIADLIPPLGAVKAGRIRELPLFTYRLDELYTLDDVGVVGGPCLVEVDELIVEVRHDNGEKHCFDFVTCKSDSTPLDLAQYFASHAREICDVSFDNRKESATSLDYESLVYPMEAATLLNAPFVFPIPDMSYKKFLVSISEDLKPRVRAKMLEEFTWEMNRFVDIQLALLNDLLKQFKPKQLAVVHERDNAALSVFYKEREKYFNNRQTFSTRTGKDEAVYDYISFLAAPFYFWKTKHILQVDNILEVDSMRKCARAHGKDMAMHSIFFPDIAKQYIIEYGAQQRIKVTP